MDNLKCESQVQEMVSKAMKTTWVIRRMRALGVSQAALVHYWKTEGRSRLEFGCPVWHSSLSLDSITI